MEFRENVDNLMSNVKVSKKLQKAILEANPEKTGNQAMKSMAIAYKRPAEAEGGMDMGHRTDMENRRNTRNTRNRKRPLWRQAAVPAAAALLVMSTMYVGAAYLIDHTPLRDIFTARDDSALPVPEAQQRPDIYGEILDDGFVSGENQAEAGTQAGESGAVETPAQEESQAPRGKYGEIVMDNELFSIEILEVTCAGRELTASYILTKKTDQLQSVHVSIDNDYMGQWRDGLAGEEYDTSRSLMRSGFGDTFPRNKLPEGCGYELAENQELCIITQLGKTDYVSGTYTLYAETFSYEAPAVEDGGESYQFVEIPDEDIREGFYRTSIEILRSGDYGLALNGALDKTEEQVHFDQYDIYVSPLTVYLTMEGTYQGEVSEIWGMHRSHKITIGFADGTETQTTVLLSGMGYGKGEIDVDMRASFGTAIDPDSIVKVMLDDILLMGE